MFYMVIMIRSEKAMAPHSSVLAWRIPGTGEPGGLPSMGSHRVGHNRSDLAAAAMIRWILNESLFVFLHFLGPPGPNLPYISS